MQCKSVVEITCSGYQIWQIVVGLTPTSHLIDNSWLPSKIMKWSFSSARYPARKTFQSRFVAPPPCRQLRVLSNYNDATKVTRFWQWVRPTRTWLNKSAQYLSCLALLIFPEFPVTKASLPLHFEPPWCLYTRKIIQIELGVINSFSIFFIGACDTTNIQIRNINYVKMLFIRASTAWNTMLCHIIMNRYCQSNCPHVFLFNDLPPRTSESSPKELLTNVLCVLYYII
jgi:hypothetical protein